MRTTGTSGSRTWLAFLLVFVLLAAGIVLGGRVYYRSYEQHHRAEAEQGLLAIADLKVSELVRWRKERLADGSMFVQNATFAALVRRAFGQPADVDAERQLQEWLDRVRVAYQYDRVFLLDAQGAQRLAVPGTPEPVAGHLAQDAAAVLRSGRLTFLDFHRDAPGRPIFLGVLVPILDDQNANRPLGTVVLRIAPETYLYPFINRWPTSSRTAETLLLRRDGNDVVYLNTLRHRPDTALILRIPLERTAVPAVKAALGQSGIMQGEDYRGVPVLAAVSSVPDSPWFLVAKIDSAEVFAPMREQLWHVVVLICALLLGAGAWVGLVWRQQRVRFYREGEKTAEALRESEALFRAIFEQAAVGIAQIGLDGRWLRVNQRICDIVGFTREELLRCTFQDITHPDDLEIDLARVRQVLAGEIQTYSMEKRYIRKDHSVVPINLTVSLVRATSGEPNHFISVVEDITERVRAETALKTSEERFRTAAENLTDVIYDWDIKEKVDWHGDIDGIMGYPPGGFPRTIEGWAATVHPDDKDRIMAALEGHLEEVTPYVVEYRVGRRDGEWRWWSARGTALRDDRGKPYKMIGSITDITERKRAEQTLRENEERFRAIFDRSTVGKSLTSPEGKLLSVNAAFAAMMGLAIEELQQVNFASVTHPDDIAQSRECIRSLLAKEHVSFRMEKRYLHKDGHYVWADVSTTLLRDSQDVPLYFITSVLDISDRKRAVAELEIKNQVFDESVVALSITDSTATITHANPEFLRMWRYATEEQVIGNRIDAFLADPADAAAILTALAAQGAWAGEFLARRADGTTFVTRGYISSLHGAQGELVGYQAANLDVTKEKEAEEALLKAKDNLEWRITARTAELQQAMSYNRGLIEASLDPLVANGLDGRITDVNRATEAITGRSRQELIGTDFAEYFTEPERARAGYQKVFREGEVRDYELAVRHKDGSIRPVLYTATVYRDQAGAVVGVFAAAHDITGLRRVERLLQNQAREHAIILDSIPALVFYKDEENRIIRVNQDFAEAMGTVREQIEGKTCFELWPAQGEDYWKADQAVLASGVAKRGIVELLETPRGTRWLQTDKVPFRDENGAITGIIGFSIDITERKQAEDKVVQLNHDLTLRSAELEAVNYELEAFSYSVSHDLKAPLRSVDGFTRMLEEDYGTRLDDEGRRLLQVVRDSTREMGQLINDLLAFSRLSRKELKLTRLTLRDLAEDAKRQVEKGESGRRIRWEVGELPPACGDEVTVREVLINLFANAVKFTRPREEAVIGIDGRVEGNDVVYSVTDNGVGFDMTYKDKLFCVFQRLHTSDEFEGTGIGLALVKRIIQRHEGRVWAEGKVDEGAAFHFTLPREGSGDQ